MHGNVLSSYLSYHPCQCSLVLVLKLMDLR